MPILVVCDACRAKLSAPDAAAGKRVKCRKCQAVLTVPIPATPEPEVEEDLELDDDPVPPPPVKRRPVEEDEDEDDDRPRRKRRVVDEDEDDEDEEEERPRKRKKSRKPVKKKGVSPVIFIVIGVAVLVLLGGGVWAVWSLVKIGEKAVKDGTPSSNSPGRGLPGAGKTPGATPDDWEAFEVAQFRALFKKGVKPAAQNLPGVPAEAARNWVANYDKEKMTLIVSVTDMDPAAVELYRANAKTYFDQIVNALSKTGPGGGMTVTSRREFDYEGSKGLEAVMTLPAGQKGTMAYRMVVAKGKLFQLMFVAERGPTLDDPMVKTFFDGFQAK